MCRWPHLRGRAHGCMCARARAPRPGRVGGRHAAAVARPLPVPMSLRAAALRQTARRLARGKHRAALGTGTDTSSVTGNFWPLALKSRTVECDIRNVAYRSVVYGLAWLLHTCRRTRMCMSERSQKRFSQMKENFFFFFIIQGDHGHRWNHHASTSLWEKKAPSWKKDDSSLRKGRSGRSP